MHDESDFITIEQLGGFNPFVEAFTACASSSCMAACTSSQALCGFIYYESAIEIGWIELEAENCLFRTSVHG